MKAEIIFGIITTASFIFGVWAEYNRRKLKKVYASETKTIHNNIAVLLGAVQAAKNQIEAQQSPKFEIGRAEGIAQTILHSTARLHCDMMEIKNSEVANLCRTGKLKSCYEEIYRLYSE